MKRLICINGHPRAGKDTLGKYFIEALDGRSTIQKMAEPIGDALKATFSLTDEEYTYYREIGKSDHLFDDKDNPTFRECMIDYGEKFLKSSFYPEIFAELLWRKMEKHVDEYRNFIITDIGFQCEFDRLCKRVTEYNNTHRADPIVIYLYRVSRESQVPEIGLKEKLKRKWNGAKNFIGDSRESVYKTNKNDKFILIEKEYDNDNTVENLIQFVNNEIRIMD